MATSAHGVNSVLSLFCLFAYFPSAFTTTENIILATAPHFLDNPVQHWDVDLWMSLSLTSPPPPAQAHASLSPRDSPQSKSHCKLNT